MYAYIIVFFIITLALSYASWRLHRLFSAKSNPCKNCCLSPSCKKYEACPKKDDEKFGGMEKKR